MAGKKTDLKGLNVLLGVTGGVAAFKAVDLASKLTAAGAAVRTVMTRNACELIREKSFESVTSQPVYTSLWICSQQHDIGHISLSEWADVLVIAPATADIIGKAAGGICDDLLSTILCTAWQKPILLAPAMNTLMWRNPMVRKNVGALTEMGYKLCGPEKGRLACGTEGPGRMSEPQDILGAIEEIAAKVKRGK